jgi:hypothetical protein
MKKNLRLQKFELSIGLWKTFTSLKPGQGRAVKGTQIIFRRTGFSASTT